MAQDSPATPTAFGRLFARWLRALAQEVERDPDLAARVAAAAALAEADAALAALVPLWVAPDQAPAVVAPPDATPSDAATIAHAPLGNATAEVATPDPTHSMRETPAVSADLSAPTVAAPAEAQRAAPQMSPVPPPQEAPSPEPASGDPRDDAPPVSPRPPAIRQTRRDSRFGPPTVAGRGTSLGRGIPDPFAIAAEVGPEGLRAALEELRAGTLRAMIRAHELDPLGKLPASAAEAKLRGAILAAVKRRGGRAG